MAKKCIFGPILSRRLGSSLGINLLPYKTCSLNCIYCECGVTTNLTTERKEYIPTQEVIESLKKYAASSQFRSAPPYCITFAGWGEPTLHSALGEIAHFIKKLFPEQKLVLITNGTLFAFYEELLEEIKEMDIIIPSLDAASPQALQAIDQPHPRITLNSYIESLIKLRKHFPGEIWLEVFIVEGINDSERELNFLKEKIALVSPHRVQINALDRNPAREGVKSPPFYKLEEIASFLGGETILPSPRKSKVVV
ncbi:MAG: radical SAM protein [Atribacterales bacterium]